MGDIKKFKKKYEPPRHPWQREVLAEEKKLRKEYALKNRLEITRVNSFLKKYKDIAKRLIATKTAQADIERKLVISKLEKLGLVGIGSELHHVLSLTNKDVLERQITSVLVRRGLARTKKQARQFVVHRHIEVGKKQITSPTHLLTLEEEGLVIFREQSNLSNAQHPERTIETKKAKEEAEKVKAKAKKDEEQKVEEKA